MGLTYVAYLTGKPRRDMILRRLAETGRVHLSEAHRYWHGTSDVPVIFGLDAPQLAILRDCLRHQRPFLFCDHAYFLRAKEWRRQHGKFTPDVWFRLCANGLHLTQEVIRPADRWCRLVSLGAPAVTNVRRNASGENILVCPPNTVQFVYPGLDNWLEKTCEAIREHTSRPIKVRRKTDPRPLQEDLAEAWAVVTFQSTVAVHALLAGKPVWCDTTCATARLSNGTDWSVIDRPYFPSSGAIQQLLCQLAYGQFQGDEFASGFALNTVEPLLEPT